MGDDRPVRYVEVLDDGTKQRRERVIYRASGLGTCPRSFLALARGVQPRPHPDWFQEVLDEGTAAEREIARQFHLSQLEDPDDPAWNAQAELELSLFRYQGREIVIRAHADDLLIDPPSPSTAVLREYKKFRSGDPWERFMRDGVEVHRNYPMQVSAMMWALIDAGHETVCQFIGGELNRDTGEINQTFHHTLIDPPVPRAGLIKLIANIEKLILAGFDPTEVECRKQFPCGHWFLHDDQLDGGQDVIELTDEAAVACAAEWVAADQRVRQMRSVLEAAEKRKKVAAEALGQHVERGGKAVVELDGQSITLSHVYTEVAESTRTVKAHTRDFIQRSKT